MPTLDDVKKALCKFLDGAADVASWTPTAADDEFVKKLHGFFCDAHLPQAGPGRPRPMYKAMRRMLARELAKRDGLSMSEATALVTAKFPTDGDLYAAATVAAASVPGFEVGKVDALGDGTLLKLLLDNLPQIMQLIMQIVALFPK